MKIVTVNDLMDQIKRVVDVDFYRDSNIDMYWKNGAALKYLEDNKINFNSMLDIGAGSSLITMYLLINRDFDFFGVEISEKEYYLEDWLKKSNRDTSRINYFIQDFLEFKTDKKFDFIFDGCAITHFNPSTELSPNDGVYKAGKSIYSSLNDDGLFICVSDCLPENTPNHRGEINKEFISVENMIKCYEMAGLELVEEPWYYDRNSINYELQQTNQILESISKEKLAYYVAFQHYDRALLVFRKKK